MKIYEEIDSASEFEFWSGAKDTVDILTNEELEIVFNMLEENYDEGMSRTDFNDFFWFETGTIAEWIGWDSFETLYKARSGENWFDTQEDYEEYLEELEEKENDEDDDE